MSGERNQLLRQLESHYRGAGWKIRRSNGQIEATGPSGVVWIGRPVVPEDLSSDKFEAEIVDLSERRMSEMGELCPLDLLPARECEPELRQMLERTGLSRRAHVSVYSLAA